MRLVAALHGTDNSDRLDTVRVSITHALDADLADTMSELQTTLAECRRQSAAGMNKSLRPSRDARCRDLRLHGEWGFSASSMWFIPAERTSQWRGRHGS
jgi:hypothetical protein